MSGVCELCDASPATVRCSQCEESGAGVIFCDTCSKGLHSSGGRHSKQGGMAKRKCHSHRSCELVVLHFSKRQTAQCDASGECKACGSGCSSDSGACCSCCC